jgi:hypothetical protein
LLNIAVIVSFLGGCMFCGLPVAAPCCFPPSPSRRQQMCLMSPGVCAGIFRTFMVPCAHCALRVRCCWPIAASYVFERLRTLVASSFVAVPCVGFCGRFRAHVVDCATPWPPRFLLCGSSNMWQFTSFHGYHCLRLSLGFEPSAWCCAAVPYPWHGTVFGAVSIVSHGQMCGHLCEVPCGECFGVSF